MKNGVPQLVVDPLSETGTMSLDAREKKNQDEWITKAYLEVGHLFTGSRNDMGLNAIERLSKYLVEDLGVPEDKILLERKER